MKPTQSIKINKDLQTIQKSSKPPAQKINIIKINSSSKERQKKWLEYMIHKESSSLTDTSYFNFVLIDPWSIQNF